MENSKIIIDGKGRESMRLYMEVFFETFQAQWIFAWIFSNNSFNKEKKVSALHFFPMFCGNF